MKKRAARARAVSIAELPRFAGVVLLRHSRRQVDFEALRSVDGAQFADDRDFLSRLHGDEAVEGPRVHPHDVRGA